MQMQRGLFPNPQRAKYIRSPLLKATHRLHNDIPFFVSCKLWSLVYLGGAGRSGTEDNLCKICMDLPADCVLLECGHLVTCTKCGKRMSECPICRQYVVRAVHVFRS